MDHGVDIGTKIIHVRGAWEGIIADPTQAKKGYTIAKAKTTEVLLALLRQLCGGVAVVMLMRLSCCGGCLVMVDSSALRFGVDFSSRYLAGRIRFRRRVFVGDFSVISYFRKTKVKGVAPPCGVKGQSPLLGSYCHVSKQGQEGSAPRENMTTNFEKLDKFEGHDFRRWQKKMHLFLTTLKVVYVLTTPMSKLMEDATVEAIKIRAKWENDDYICRGHILNGLSDSLFDVYTNVESAKESWDSLESKYMAEDSSSKKFLVCNFNNYKMVDSRPVMAQYNELLRILRQYTQHGLKMDESIFVSSIIDKLPPSWNNFKHTLKHGKDDLSLVQRAFYVHVDAITWWIDSGAITHVCKDRCWFKTYEPVEDGYVLYMGDNHFAHVHGKGSVVLESSSGKSITLFNALYVPKLYRGGEYYDPVFFQFVRIIHETTTPYTPQQNGVAERKNRALKEMVNSMLSYSGLSDGFWGEAMLTACYLLNRVPNKRNMTTPYELWYKKRPNLTFLWVWVVEPLLGLHTLKRKLWVKKVLIASLLDIYVIEPNDYVSINTIIESRDAIFDEIRFSSIPKPKDIIPNSDESQRDDHSNDVLSETPKPRKDPIQRNIKWYQSLVRSFDQEKNNIQAQQKKKMVKSSPSLENKPCCSKSCKKNTKSLNSKITDLTDKLSDSKNLLFHYKAGLSQVEERLVEFKNQKIKYYEKIRVLEFKVESRANCIESLTKELEELKKEKEGLDTKLTGYLTASKDLDNLIGSQKSDKNKEGLGYSDVPPLSAQVYSPPKKDMSWTGLPKFADDTITDYTRPSPSVESNPNGLQNNSSYVSKIKESTGSILSKRAVKFVKAADCTEVKTNKVEAARKSSVRYAEMFRRTSKSPNVRGNQRNWNNLESQQLGNNFVMKNKACFNCGDFDHQSYDCGLWVKKGRACPKNNYTHKNPIQRNIKWYQSLVRSFDQEKNNIQAQQKKKMVKSSSSSENEPCCSKSCKTNTESLNSKITDLTDKLSDSKNMSFHYKAGLSQVEGRLVEFKNQEIKYCEKIRVLEFKVESRANCIESLTKELEELKKEKERLYTKLTGYLTASKDLDNLIGSQKSDKNKEGLRYSDVPPPPAQVYSPPKKDMSWTGLPEFADNTITDYTRPSPCVESNLNGLQNNSSYVSKIEESTGSILSKPAALEKKERIDYFDTYAPVARITTIKLLLALAAIYNLVIHQMDVKTTFLNGDLEEEVYMKQPEGFVMPVDKTKKFLSSKFSMKDMGEADVILGIEIKRENKGIKSLCQIQHVDQLEYSRAIGCLMYAMTSTRPDIAYVVGRLSRFTSNPSRHHWDAITRVFKYLKGTINYGLSYIRYPLVLEGYSDASWINHVEDLSSTSGWLFLLEGGTILWASKKQTCITSSTMEFEFVALDVAGKEAEWLRNLIHETPIWPKPIAPISIHCDSAATLAKAYSQKYNGKSKHLGVRHSMMRELIMNGVIYIEFVRSQHNLADHLRKALARDLVIKKARVKGVAPPCKVKGQSPLLGSRCQFLTVFSSDVDGNHITGGMLLDKIDSIEFDTMNHEDIVGVYLLAILQLVLLGHQLRHNVPDCCLRLVVDRKAWDMYHWGSYVWPKLYQHLRDANVTGWDSFYAAQRVPGSPLPKYSLSGFTWAFKGARPNARLRADAFEAKAKWWVSSRAFFDSRIDEPPRISSPINQHSRYHIPKDIYRHMWEQDRSLKETQSKVAAHVLLNQILQVGVLSGRVIG
nr:zinc finger, CCHC-type [Tanacetum cinerariifolium]